MCRDTLQAYRSNELVNGAVTFGMNAIVLQGVDQALRGGAGRHRGLALRLKPSPAGGCIAYTFGLDFLELP